MPKFIETLKNIGRAVRDQGKGKATLTGMRTRKKKRKLTPAEKRLIRLKQGMPLSSGRTPKKTKTKGSGAVAAVARKLAQGGSKKGISRGRKEAIKKDTSDFKTHDRNKKARDAANRPPGAKTGGTYGLGRPLTAAEKRRAKSTFPGIKTKAEIADTKRANAERDKRKAEALKKKKARRS